MSRLLAVAVVLFPLCAARAQAESSGEITAVAVSRFGNWLATAGSEEVPGQPGKRAIRIWEVRTKALKRTYLVSAESIRCLAFDKGEDFLHAVDDQGRRRLFSVDETREVDGIPAVDPATWMLLVDPRDDLLLTVDEQLRLWGKDAVTASFRPGRVAIADVEFLANGSQLAVAAGGETMLLHPRTLQVLERIGRHDRPVTTFSLWQGPDGLMMYTGHGNGSVECWHAGRKSLRRTISAHRGAVAHVAAYDRGKRCLTLSRSGELRFWDGTSGERLAEDRVAEGELKHVASSLMGAVLVTVSGPDVQVRTIDPEVPAQVSSVWTLVPAETAIESDVATAATLIDPNRLRNWRIARGDWKMQNRRIVGAGDSSITFRQALPNDLTLRLKLKVSGETNPRVRFGGFHFGYEGRQRQFFLHGPKATGTPFAFEPEREYAVEIEIAGEQARLRIDGEEVAQSNPKRNPKRTIAIEAGGKRSRGSCEFYDIEIVLPEAKASDRSE